MISISMGVGDMIEIEGTFENMSAKMGQNAQVGEESVVLVFFGFFFRGRRGASPRRFGRWANGVRRRRPRQCGLE